MIERDLPHSEEAERNVISCVLLDGASALVTALDSKITEACFYDPKNSKLWRAIIWNHNHGRPIETAIIVDELRKVDKLDSIGLGHILGVSDAIPTTAAFTHWLEQVRETYVLRELIKCANDVRECAYGYKGNVEDFVAATSRILSIRHASQKQETLSSAANDVFDLCQRILAGEDTEVDRGLPWPWPDWNRRFGPAQAGELIVLAARPGRGKSSAGRQIAWHWSKTVGDVLLFSREMPVCGLPQLFAQSLSGQSWREFRRNELTSADSATFIESVKEVQANKRIHIYDRDRTLAQLTARIKAFHQIKPIKGIVIDYLQRYDPQQDRGETRDVAIGRMTMALKDAAIECGIPIVLLAQISRSVERENREPMLSDLRESGNIEQDADRVIFLDAPTNTPDGTTQDLNDGTVRRIFVNAIQAKGRGEGQDRVGMMFNRPITSFESIVHS